MSYSKIDLQELQSGVRELTREECIRYINEKTGFKMCAEESYYDEIRKHLKNINCCSMSLNNISNADFVSFLDEGGIKVIAKPEEFEVVLFGGWRQQLKHQNHGLIRIVQTSLMHFQCPACGKKIVADMNPSRRKEFSLCEQCFKAVYYLSEEYRQKYNAEMIKKYGETSPIRIPHIRKKIRSTMIERYGVPFSGMNPELLEKTWTTTEKKCGRRNRFTGLDCIELYGPRSHYCVSKLEVEIAEKIHEVLDDKYIIRSNAHKNMRAFFLSEKNVLGKKRYIFPDIFIEEKKLIIEIFGDYWHANPSVFSKEHIFTGGRTMEEIHKKDRSRIESLSVDGIKVYVVWEKDWREDKERVFKEILKTVEEA